MSFTCNTIEHPEIRAKLEKIAKIKSLATPPLCLPNIHPKRGLESPPQFVAATSGTIVPMLSAPAMNCGMSVFITNLTREDFSPEFLESFAANLRKGVSDRVGRIRALSQWFGITKPESGQYDLTKKELEDIFLEGAPAAVRKYGLPENELEHMEFGGSTLSQKERQEINLKNLVPRSSYTNGRHEMGYNFGGNHFLEIHAIEKILDSAYAEKWGLREGQLALFYHGGGGHATYHLGRYFARREKNTPFEKIALFFLKLAFHFSFWEGTRNFRVRWHAYFSHSPFPEIPASSQEGKRLMQSIQIGLNYGYAFRVALLKRINDALPKGTAHFLWDAAHNSIREEQVGNKKLVVHRQDAVEIIPDRPLMIAGANNTLSYIGVAGSAPEKTLFSVTPSAGKSIEQAIIKGISKPEAPRRITLISKRKNPTLEEKEHMTSEGLFDVVREFEKEDIIKPVAYLRPMGSVKGH